MIIYSNMIDHINNYPIFISVRKYSKNAGIMKLIINLNSDFYGEHIIYLI